MLALVAALLAAQTPELPDCLALLEHGAPEEARACYARHASDPVEDDEAASALARELADLVSSLELPAPPAELSAPRAPPLDLAQLATSGKAELLVVSALSGAYAAELGTWMVGISASSLGASPGPLFFGGMLLAPIGGGLVGLGVSTGVVLALPQLTAGDANFLRASLLLGAFNSVMVAVTGASWSMISYGSGAPTLGLMLLAQGLGSAVGVGGAVLFDLPEGAGSAALSGALWTGLSAMLGANMFGAFKGDTRAAPLLIALGGNAGFAGGLALAATVLPVSRADTWALDLGGAVGVLGGAALALGLRAPNPLLGYGSMVLGGGLGMVGGVAAARLVPAGLDALPNVVAVTPLAVPALGAGDPPLGVALEGRF